MSYDYLNDDFGLLRQHPTRFTETQIQALRLLRQYVAHSLSPDDFGEQMMQLAQHFHTLLKDDAGNYVFDQDTPVWLNSFLGYGFARWNKNRLTVNAARKNEKMTADPAWKEVEEFIAEQDESMSRLATRCLEKWEAAQKEKAHMQGK